MRLFIFILLFFSFAQTSFGNTPEETRRTQLLSELRCLVCQNESLADSDAPLAKDLRAKINAQISEGKTNEEIIQYLTARYGEFILFKPSMTHKNSLLWFGPGLFLLFGLGALTFAIRQHKKRIQKNALSAEEKTQLEKLLK